MTLRKSDKYISDAQSVYNPPQVQQTIFLKSKLTDTFPDTYINQIHSVAQHRENLTPGDIVEELVDSAAREPQLERG